MIKITLNTALAAGLTIFVTLPHLSEAAENSSTIEQTDKVQDRTCDELLESNYSLEPLRLGSNPLLRVMDRHAVEILREMENSLYAVQRPSFRSSIRDARGSQRVKNSGSVPGLSEKIRFNPFISNHPGSRVALVHEAQHIIDKAPGTYFLGHLVRLFDLNEKEKTERNAISREYDYLRRVLNDPEFDETKLGI